MYRYFSFRLYPSRSQERRMIETIEVCRRFFNVLLSERLAAHRLGGGMGLAQLLRRVAVFRSEDSAAAQVHSHSLQLVVTAANVAWKAWRRRGSKGNGPRERQIGQVRSFGFKTLNNGFGLSGRRLRLFKIGRVAVRWHRPLAGEIRTLSIYRQAGSWYAAFCCEVELTPLPSLGREIGIDLGTENLLTLSSGEIVPNPRFGLAAHARLTTLRTRLHQAVPGSKAFIKALLRLGGLQVRVAARRRDYIAKIVVWLVNDYDRIAVENLDNHKLAKMRASVSDAGWGAFCRMLSAKAAATGKTVTFVKPAWTSQTCSACGVRAERHLPLTERQFTCAACSYSADRDVNAARLVLLRGREIWETN